MNAYIVMCGDAPVCAYEDEWRATALALILNNGESDAEFSVETVPFVAGEHDIEVRP